MAGGGIAYENDGKLRTNCIDLFSIPRCKLTERLKTKCDLMLPHVDAYITAPEDHSDG